MGQPGLELVNVTRIVKMRPECTRPALSRKAAIDQAWLVALIIAFRQIAHGRRIHGFDETGIAAASVLGSRNCGEAKAIETGCP